MYPYGGVPYYGGGCGCGGYGGGCGCGGGWGGAGIIFIVIVIFLVFALCCNPRRPYGPVL